MSSADEHEKSRRRIGAPEISYDFVLVRGSNPDMHLKSQFGLSTAVALLIGQVIAVGIFLTPAGMAKAVGSPFWLLVIWVVLGALTLSGALCYGELAARFPEAGGSYVYLREIWGKPVA